MLKKFRSLLHFPKFVKTLRLHLTCEQVLTRSAQEVLNYFGKSELTQAEINDLTAPRPEMSNSKRGPLDATAKQILLNFYSKGGIQEHG